MLPPEDRIVDVSCSYGSARLFCRKVALIPRSLSCTRSFYRAGPRCGVCQRRNVLSGVPGVQYLIHLPNLKRGGRKNVILPRPLLLLGPASSFFFVFFFFPNKRMPFAPINCLRFSSTEDAYHSATPGQTRLRRFIEKAAKIATRVLCLPGKFSRKSHLYPVHTLSETIAIAVSSTCNFRHVPTTMNVRYSLFDLAKSNRTT